MAFVEPALHERLPSTPAAVKPWLARRVPPEPQFQMDAPAKQAEWNGVGLCCNAERCDACRTWICIMVFIRNGADGRPLLAMARQEVEAHRMTASIQVQSSSTPNSTKKPWFDSAFAPKTCCKRAAVLRALRPLNSRTTSKYRGRRVQWEHLHCDELALLYRRMQGRGQRFASLRLVASQLLPVAAIRRAADMCLCVLVCHRKPLIEHTLAARGLPSEVQWTQRAPGKS